MINMAQVALLVSAAQNHATIPKYLYFTREEPLLASFSFFWHGKTQQKEVCEKHWYVLLPHQFNDEIPTQPCRRVIY